MKFVEIGKLAARHCSGSSGRCSEISKDFSFFFDKKRKFIEKKGEDTKEEQSETGRYSGQQLGFSRVVDRSRCSGSFWALVLGVFF